MRIGKLDQWSPVRTVFKLFLRSKVSVWAHSHTGMWTSVCVFDETWRERCWLFLYDPKSSTVTTSTPVLKGQFVCCHYLELQLARLAMDLVALELPGSCLVSMDWNTESLGPDTTFDTGQGQFDSKGHDVEVINSGSDKDNDLGDCRTRQAEAGQRWASRGPRDNWPEDSLCQPNVIVDGQTKVVLVFKSHSNQGSDELTRLLLFSKRAKLGCA